MMSISRTEQKTNEEILEAAVGSQNTERTCGHTDSQTGKMVGRCTATWLAVRTVLEGRLGPTRKEKQWESEDNVSGQVTEE